MLTCIAIDDEPLALEVLKKYIAKIYFLDLKGVFTDPFEAQKIMDTAPVDILFLDIQMPDINGIEFSRIINKKNTADRKSTRLNSSHYSRSRMPSSA